MKILFLSCASAKWGIGHLVRSRELIRTLQDEDVQVTSTVLVPSAEDRQELNHLLMAFNQCAALLTDISCDGYDGIVVDVHHDLKGLVADWLFKENKKAVALDWYGQDERMILNKINLRGNAQALTHVIVRRELLNSAKRNQPKRFDALVLLGGHDRCGDLRKLFKLLSSDERLANRRFAFVAGPLAEKLIQDQPDPRYQIFYSPQELPDLMNQARVGICNGGGVLMEFTAMGIPTIIFPQTGAEANFMKTFVQQGCSVAGTFDHEQLFMDLNVLLENDDIWRQRSLAAIALIDGKGASRIVKIIKNTFTRGVVHESHR